MNKQSKLIMASLIRNKKDTLFGNISRDIRMCEWKNIFNSLAARGILVKKDWKHLRDVAWQNLKRGTLVKIKGSPDNLSELDHIVIEIIGKEPPALSGMVDGFCSPHLEEVRSPKPATAGQNASDDGPFVASEKPNSTQSADDEEEIISLKRKRLLLEIYNLQLDARRKEIEQGLPRSRLTAGLEETLIIQTPVALSSACKDRALSFVSY